MKKIMIIVITAAVVLVACNKPKAVQVTHSTEAPKKFSKLKAAETVNFLQGSLIGMRYIYNPCTWRENNNDFNIMVIENNMTLDVLDTFYAKVKFIDNDSLFSVSINERVDSFYFSYNKVDSTHQFHCNQDYPDRSIQIEISYLKEQYMVNDHANFLDKRKKCKDSK